MGSGRAFAHGLPRRRTLPMKWLKLCWDTWRGRQSKGLIGARITLNNGGFCWSGGLHNAQGSRAQLFWRCTHESLPGCDELGVRPC